MGYDFERGRLDDTVHPFEISFTRTDARITGRFHENWLPGGLFAVWHEAGHGIYEQGVSPEFTRSVFTTDFVNLYAVGGSSFGTHESQSRLWENRVGRSRRFWEQNFGALKAEFPDQLADVSVGEFHSSELGFLWTSGATLIGLVIGLINAAVAAFRFSFFFCSASAVYLLLRHDVDEKEMDEVFVESQPLTAPPLVTTPQTAD